MLKGLILIMTLVSSCSYKHVINNQSHVFERVPKKLIWLQVAGLSESHFVYLKLANGKPNFKIAPEAATCFGKQWGYNLYSMRSSSESSMLTQLTESKNMKNTCEDYLKDPFWENILDDSIKIGVLEIGSEGKKCKGEKRDFFSKAVHWKMESSRKRDLTFHQDMKDPFEKGKVYYDVSCKKGRCYSTAEGNIKSLYKKYFENSSDFIFIIRDFSLEKMLKKKNFNSFAEKAGELNYLANYLFHEAEQDENLLVLITGASSIPVELPAQGYKNWKDAKSMTKKLLYKRSSILSPVMAKGAGAEKFCGIFEESQVVKRTY